MSDHTDELLVFVRDCADDILYDNLPKGTAVRSKDIQFIEGGDNDSTTYGRFRIVVNDGEFYIDIEADGVFKGFQDCFDWSGDSHYTKDVYFDELQDFQYEVKRVIEMGGNKNVIPGN